MIESRLLKWTLFSTAIVLLLYMAGTLVGLTLPEETSVSRSVLISSSPDVVWRTVFDPASQGEWRKDIRRIEVLPPRAGQPVWRERYRNGRSLILATSQLISARLWERRVADPRAPFTGTWTLRLDPEGQGTRISLTETTSVRHPFFRFVARYIVGHARAVESYLRFLSLRFAPPAASR